jgi:hypothetical protein
MMDGVMDDDDGVDDGVDGARTHHADASTDRVYAHVKAHTARIADGEARRRNHTLTPRLASALGELAHAVTREIARDVRAYANHASRDVVDGTDVALRARKINPRLRHVRVHRDEDADGDGDGERAANAS